MPTPEELFPGFKTPPTDPSRDLRPAFTIARHPEEDDDQPDYDEDIESEECPNCEGWGFFNCFCGGDFCICSYNGERPCFQCS